MENKHEKEIFKKLQMFYNEAGWFQEPSPANDISASNIINPEKVYLTFELSEQKITEITRLFFEPEIKHKSHSKQSKMKKKK